MLWPPYRRRLLAEADEYMETFGDRAYSQCRTDCIEAMEKHDSKRMSFLSNVRNVLAKKLVVIATWTRPRATWSKNLTIQAREWLHIGRKTPPCTDRDKRCRERTG